MIDSAMRVPNADRQNRRPVRLRVNTLIIWTLLVTSGLAASSSPTAAQTGLALQRLSADLCCFGSSQGSVSHDGSTAVFENLRRVDGKNRSEVFLSVSGSDRERIEPVVDGEPSPPVMRVRGTNPLSSTGDYLALSASAEVLDERHLESERVLLMNTKTGVALRAPAVDREGTPITKSCLASVSARGNSVVFIGDREVPEEDEIAVRSHVYLWRVGDASALRMAPVSRSAMCDDDHDEWAPALDESGGRVAFVSRAIYGEVGSVASDQTEVYVVDAELREIVKLSYGIDGAEADGSSDDVSMSLDGNKVVFRSFATNLTRDRSSTFGRIYLAQVDSRNIELISTSGASVTDGESRLPVISGDGRYVIYSTAATNLYYRRWWERDIPVLVRHDEWTGQTVRLPVNYVQIMGDPLMSPDVETKVSVSAGAETLVFDSGVELMGDDWISRLNDVWLFDVESLAGASRSFGGVQYGKVRRINMSKDGEEANYDRHSYSPSIDRSGDRVTFVSEDNRLADVGIDMIYDLAYEWQLNTGHLRVLGEVYEPHSSSLTPPSLMGQARPRAVLGQGGVYALSGSTAALGDLLWGIQWEVAFKSICNLGSWIESERRCASPRLSDSGEHLVFQNGIRPWIGSRDGSTADVFLYSRSEDKMLHVSEAKFGDDGTGESGQPAIDGNGTRVVFTSSSDALIASDTNGVWDVFLYSVEDATIRRLSMSSTGREANGGGIEPDISGNGEYAVFASRATNLMEDDPPRLGEWTVYMVNIESGELTQVDRALRHEGAIVSSYYPAISDSGRYVAFISTTRFDGDGLGTLLRPQVYLFDRDSGEVVLVSRGVDGSMSNGGSGPPDVEEKDGSVVVAFSSDARNLVDDDGNFATDIFVYVSDESLFPPVPERDGNNPTPITTPRVTPTWDSVDDRVFLPVLARQ